MSKGMLRLNNAVESVARRLGVSESEVEGALVGLRKFLRALHCPRCGGDRSEEFDLRNPALPPYDGLVFSDESVELIEQAISKELDSLAADGLLERLTPGVTVAIERDRSATVTFEIDPCEPPYRAVRDQAEIDARLQAAIEKALLHGSACTSSSAPNAQ